MKREEMKKVTNGAYEFVQKPVMRTVGENKVRIGWVVVPNVPKDADGFELLTGMLDDDILTNEQLAKAAFGQGFDLECRRKLTGMYLAATTEGYNKAEAQVLYWEEAFQSEEVKVAALPAEKMAAVERYCKEQWLATAPSNTSDWNNETTVNCWEL
jgi:hypothetical protein